MSEANRPIDPLATGRQTPHFGEAARAEHREHHHEPESELTRAVRSQKEAICRLSASVGLLEEKLAPVLAGKFDDEVREASTGVDSNLSRIDHHNWQIDRLNRIVASLTHRAQP